MDDDYDDERPHVPTFSEGSQPLRRGFNSRAAASRASASKSAISIASKASSIIAASIQNASIINTRPSNHIYNNQHRTHALNIPQFNPIVQTVINHSVDDKFPKITNPIVLSQPYIPPQLPEKPKSDILSSMNNFIHQNDIIISNKKDLDHNTSTGETIRVEEIYRTAIHVAHCRKLEILADTKPLIIEELRRYKPVKYILHNTLTEDVSTNKEHLEELINNIRTSISLTDKQVILDNIEKYQTSLRISNEEPSHKRAFQQALTNKRVYLTSDT